MPVLQFTRRYVYGIYSGWWYTYPSEKYGSQLGLLFPSLARWWFHDHAMTKQFAQNLVAIGSTSRQSGLGGLSSIPASKQLSNTCGAIGIMQIWGKLQQFANSKQRHHKKRGSHYELHLPKHHSSKSPFYIQGIADGILMLPWKATSALGVMKYDCTQVVST